MPERDYVDEVRTVSFRGVVDFDEFYKVLRRWFKQSRYNLKEVDYQEFEEAGKKRLLVKWEAGKKVSDYVKCVIELVLKLEDYEEVVVDKRRMVEGKVSVEFAAFLVKDYEETWHRTSFIKFMREVFDKYGKGSVLKQMESELRGDVNRAVVEVKRYLNVRKKE